MTEAYQLGIPPQVFRQIPVKDLQVIQRITAAKNAKREQMQVVYDAIARAK